MEVYPSIDRRGDLRSWDTTYTKFSSSRCTDLSFVSIFFFSVISLPIPTIPVALPSLLLCLERVRLRSTSSPFFLKNFVSRLQTQTVASDTTQARGS